MTEERDRAIIRHLVLSGGGELGVCFYGALRDSNKAGFWQLAELETIYSTSVGSLIGPIVCLTSRVSWDLIDHFLRKRPWDTVFDINIQTCMNSFANCGVLGKRTIVDFLSPILRAADLDVDITLREFSEITGVEHHFMTSNLTRFEPADISCKTHPHWTLADAVYASSALPGLFQPIEIDGEMYADGGIFCNFPIAQCLQRISDARATSATATSEGQDTPIDLPMDKPVVQRDILCMRRKCVNRMDDPVKSDNLLNYLSTILRKMLFRVSINIDSDAANPAYYVISFEATGTTSVYDIYRYTRPSSDNSMVIELIEQGAQKWREFAEEHLSEAPQPPDPSQN